MATVNVKNLDQSVEMTLMVILFLKNNVVQMILLCLSPPSRIYLADHNQSQRRVIAAPCTKNNAESTKCTRCDLVDNSFVFLKKLTVASNML